MNQNVISSVQNPLVKQLKRLNESARERRKLNQTLLEGIHLAQTYLGEGLKPQRYLLSEAALGNAEIAALLAGTTFHDLVILSDPLFASLFDVQPAVGIVLLIDIPLIRPLDPRFILLLEDVQDPGNVGTILRTAAAAAADAVYLSHGCADVWSPKVLRAAMGAHFGIQIHERVALPEVLEHFDGISVATHLQARHTLYQQDLTGKVAMIFGNEGQGVSPDLLGSVSTRIIIPMPGKAESLNVAIAAAVCMYERVRQLQHCTPGGLD